MAKKRPTLDAFLTSQSEEIGKPEQLVSAPANKASNEVKSSNSRDGQSLSKKKAPRAPATSEKAEIVRHMLYIPLSVYDQLQELVFEEQRGQSKRRKMHDYLLDAIDLLFKEKGLKPISKLIDKNS